MGAQLREAPVEPPGRPDTLHHLNRQPLCPGAATGGGAGSAGALVKGRSAAYAYSLTARRGGSLPTTCYHEDAPKL